MAQGTVETEDLLQPDVANPGQLDNYLKRKAPSNSPFKVDRRSEIVSAIFEASEDFELNPTYILAHAIWESGWGRSSIARTKSNLFGWGAIDSGRWFSTIGVEPLFSGVSAKLVTTYPNSLRENLLATGQLLRSYKLGMTGQGIRVFGIQKEDFSPNQGILSSLIFLDQVPLITLDSFGFNNF